MDRFYIEVEGSHNYFPAGVWCTTRQNDNGRKALDRFYASVRLASGEWKRVKDAPTRSAPYRLQGLKNKSAAFKHAEFEHTVRKGTAVSSSIDMVSKQGLSQSAPGSPMRRATGAEGKRTPAPSDENGSTVQRDRERS